MNKNQIKTSPEFKKRTFWAIISILVFALTYLLILAVTLLTTILCILGSIYLVVTVTNIITIGLGLALTSFCIIILIFLVKFIFKSHKVDTSHLHEIAREDEPKLFHIIERIATEVKTNFPHKVYLSADVNAAVTYNSSFLSLFIPIKKNLQLGLGLINSITVDELEAILAHEFGHFSQKTMKVGNYVYNVNRIIYNMLNDNTTFNKGIQAWADVSGYFSIAVTLAVQIIKGIQWILVKFYDLVNKTYMGLSREMEFHADEIATHITGSKPLVNSLLRMGLAESAFNAVIAFYNDQIKNNLTTKNLYINQTFVLKFIASINNFPLENSLPKISLASMDKLNISKLIIEDQWASHPSLKDRIDRIQKNGTDKEENNLKLATTVFSEIEKTEQIITQKLFSEVKYTDTTTLLAAGDFEAEYVKVIENASFPKIYNGYYDNKNPIPFELETTFPENQILLEELFSDNKVSLAYTALALKNDLGVLEQIAQGALNIKTFDYDGIKYKRKECRKLITKLNLKLEEINFQLIQNDIKIFKFFYNLECAENKDTLLEHTYQEFFDFDKEFDTKYQIYSNLLERLQIINTQNSYKQVKNNFFRVSSLEKKLKIEIRNILANNSLRTEIDKDIREVFELYLSRNWTYINNEEYFEDNISVLLQVMDNYAYILFEEYHLLKRNLLNYQDSLIVTNV